MYPRQIPHKRGIWLLVLTAMAVLPLLFGFVVWFTSMSPGRAVDAGAQRIPILPILAGLFCVVAIVFAFAKLGSATDSDVPASVFFTDSLLALAFSEMSCLVGYMHSMSSPHPFLAYLPFGAATVAVDLAVILPFGLRYWGSRE